MAYILAVFLWRARVTVPNDPQPNFLSGMSWKSLIEVNLRFETIFGIRNRK